MVVSKMGMALDSADLITSYLRDKIYSDKTLACVRETITNAIDEHNKHNIDKDVEVSLKKNNGGDYVWAVRDYAKGLSEEDVRNIYGMYGGSTKRNDNKQIGGFGIGALSPFAIVDSFNVTSHFNGVKTVYVCSLSSSEIGASVGQIYKFHEEPTPETGIEVSLQLNSVNGGVDALDRKTKDFVEAFMPTANIKYINRSGEVFTPNQPDYSTTINGYTFNSYEGRHINRSYIKLRMGGVVYSDVFTDISDIKGGIIVDIPIGKVTIPISRENIEDTPANKRVTDEIIQLFKDFRASEIEKLTLPKFGETFLKGGNDKVSYIIHTDWFSFNMRDIFSNTVKLSKMISSVNNTKDPQTLNNGSKIIYKIPNIKTYKSWVARLKDYMHKVIPNNSYFYIVDSLNLENLLSEKDIDISDVVFLDVKKLDLPRINKEKNTPVYNVYKNGRIRGTFSAETLEAHVNQYNPFDSNWLSKVKTYEDLNMRSINLGKENYQDYFSTCSKKLVSDLVKIGWVEVTSKEYEDANKKIQNRLRHIANIERNVNELRSYYFKVAPPSKMVEFVKEKPKNLKRVKLVYDKIINERSTRSRILMGIVKSYQQEAFINRKDLRKILTLKD
jgi:hypothetical protein